MRHKMSTLEDEPYTPDSGYSQYESSEVDEIILDQSNSQVEVYTGLDGKEDTTEDHNTSGTTTLGSKLRPRICCGSYRWSQIQEETWIYHPLFQDEVGRIW